MKFPVIEDSRLMVEATISPRSAAFVLMVIAVVCQLSVLGCTLFKSNPTVLIAKAAQVIECQQIAVDCFNGIKDKTQDELCDCAERWKLCNCIELIRDFKEIVDYE